MLKSFLSKNDRAKYFDHASRVLSDNDLGHYTVPTHGLYPFQWNWDSCLCALGQSYIDEERAWVEISTLFDHQWEDGMVPHIIFHKKDDGYFPGPEVYQTNRPIPTSGLTQPPVAGFVVRRLYDRVKNRDLADQYARDLIPKIKKWHDWFFRCRDRNSSGLAAIIHPWETGRDNSIDWDGPLSKVPTDGVRPFQRRDTSHANPAHRPTDEQYKRYIWLVQTYKEAGWENDRLHDITPFKIVDPGFNAILIRSCADLAVLAEALGEHDIARQSQQQADNGLKALDTLWSESHGQYLCWDRCENALIDSASIGGILPVFANIPNHRVDALVRRIEKLANHCTYSVPSHDPTDGRFDHIRYWRGPVWLIVNYMIADGLFSAGQKNLPDRIVEDSFRLIEDAGFAEYHSPLDATPCGGGHFTWTAAMIIEMMNLWSKDG